MATTLKELKTVFDEAGIKYSVNDSKTVISVEYPTNRYRNDRDRAVLDMEIALEEEGRFFSLAVPRCYNYRELPYKDMLLKVLLIVSLFTKMIQFEYDKMSGYIRAVIEFPLEDSPLTKKQLLRCIRGLTEQLDEYHDMIISAAGDNILVLPEQEGEDMRNLFSEIFDDVLAYEREISRENDGPAS